jgi:hypothetical protein
MPLEPIEEKDMDLKNKFVEKKPEEAGAEGASKEALVMPEKTAERQEGVVEKDDAYAKIVSKLNSTSPQVDDSHIKSDAMAVGKEMDIESRVKNLVDIAMQKGVVHAVNVARHIDDNYVLDKFHDKMMAEELHAALLEKGLIKNL